MVEARDTLHTSEPEQGRWAESRAGWCTNSLGNANATGGSMLGNVASEAKRGAVTVGLRFAQGFTSWGVRRAEMDLTASSSYDAPQILLRET